MTSTRDGVAVASACDACSPLIGSPPPFEPNRHMAIVHDHHIAGLVAAGWVVTEYPHEPPDVVCVHYHAKWWQDG